MALSANVRRLLSAYDDLTNFAGGPDLPWVVETYDELDDCTVRNMIWAFCYAWAASQRAAGCCEGSVDHVAQALYAALPTWDSSLPRARKIVWLCRIGVTMVLPEREPRPAAHASDSAPNGHGNDTHRREPRPAVYASDSAPQAYSNGTHANRNGHNGVADTVYHRNRLAETTLLHRLDQAVNTVQKTSATIERLQLALKAGYNTSGSVH